MKYLAFFSLFTVLLAAGACDRDLKEHPLPPQLKQQMEALEQATQTGQFISGTVQLSPAMASKLPENPTLFLVARPEGVAGGPPLAAKRYSLIKFPFEYRIGQENVMIEGNRFEGKIALTARLDRDGLAQASPGDIEGTATAQAGDVTVRIFLDRLVEGPAAPAAAKTVSGTIRVDPALAGQLPPAPVLFLIARSEGAQRGMPLAVKKLVGVELPYKFTLGQDDVMLPGAVFDGPVTLFARLDADGDAAPGPGDIDGKAAATAGDENIEILLDRLIGG